MPEVEPPRLPDFLSAELPFGRSARRLERGPDRGRIMHLVDHGHRLARPVLLVHGNPAWSFLWRKVIERLAPRRFRSIAPDLLGFGFSDKLPNPADHTLERHLAALSELVEALDLRGVLLVGQDWGGPLVTGIGARFPDRIAGLVLANTAVLVPDRPRGTWFHRFARMPWISDLVFRGLGFPQNVMSRVQGQRSSIARTILEAYRWPLRGWRNRAGPIGMARMVPNSAQHPSVPQLRRGMEWALGFAGPMALVWGMKDPLLGRALGRHEKAFPRATVTRTDAGHFLQEEVPDAIAAAIEDVTARAAPDPRSP